MQQYTSLVYHCILSRTGRRPSESGETLCVVDLLCAVWGGKFTFNPSGFPCGSSYPSNQGCIRVIIIEI